MVRIHKTRLLCHTQQTVQLLTSQRTMRFQKVSRLQVEPSLLRILFFGLHQEKINGQTTPFLTLVTSDTRQTGAGLTATAGPAARAAPWHAGPAPAGGASTPAPVPRTSAPWMPSGFPNLFPFCVFSFSLHVPLFQLIF